MTGVKAVLYEKWLVTQNLKTLEIHGAQHICLVQKLIIPGHLEVPLTLTSFLDYFSKKFSRLIKSLHFHRRLNM